MKRDYDEVTRDEGDPGLAKPTAPKLLTLRSEPFKPKSAVDLGRQFFSNVLMHYDQARLLPSMVKFSNVFFKHMHAHGLDEKKTIKHVFMTSFGFETELLASVIGSTKKLLLVNDSSDGNFELKECFNGHNNMTVIFPSKSHKGYGFGAFHPKLWLIEFEDSTLRVVVGSGNLSIGDWTVWNNCLWYKDFEQKTYAKMMDQRKEEIEKELALEGDKPKKLVQNTLEDFGEYLLNFIEKLFPKGIENLHKFGGIQAHNFDFKVPIDPILIASLPGRHPIVAGLEGKSIHSFGLERLKQIMRVYPPAKAAPPKDMRIVYQTSSVGQLSSAFLIRFLGRHLLSRLHCSKSEMFPLER